MSNELLTIDPVNLHFPFELNTCISCPLTLTNKTDNYVAFKVKTTKPKEYWVSPSAGVVLPRSSCEVLVFMRGRQEAPADMKCNDKFLIQCVVARPGTTATEVTREMFSKEADHLNYLFRRIEESRVAVAIFSERYTESCWCLDELVKMTEQMEQGKLVVVPVFYRLDPTACKRLTGAFGDNFRNLMWMYRSEPKRIQKWKKALSSVFGIIGLTSDIRSDESKFVDSIVEEVKKVLMKINTEERET